MGTGMRISLWPMVVPLITTRTRCGWDHDVFHFQTPRKQDPTGDPADMKNMAPALSAAIRKKWGARARRGGSLS